MNFTTDDEGNLLPSNEPRKSDIPDNEIAEDKVELKPSVFKHELLSINQIKTVLEGITTEEFMHQLIKIETPYDVQLYIVKYNTEEMLKEYDRLLNFNENSPVLLERAKLTRALETINKKITKHEILNSVIDVVTVIANSLFKEYLKNGFYKL